MGFEVIATQIAMLGIAMLIGFLGVKLKYLGADLRNAISSVIVKITLPLLIITSITSQTLERDMLKNAGLLIAIEIPAIALMIGLGLLTAKLFRLKNATRTIHTCMSAFGNVIFLGYPLITALYGAEGLFYAIIYALVNDSFVWTLCVYLMGKESGNRTKSPVKNLINPNTVSFVIAIPMLFLGLKLPGLIHDALASVGSLTTYLSMLFIGMTLAVIDLREIYKRFSIFVLSFVKMLLVPVLLIFVLGTVGLDKTLAGVLILQVGMPVQTVLTILANEYHSDFKYATECVFITTVLSLGTLPLLYHLILTFL